MSIRNLDYILKPSSVAVIGADETPYSVGSIIMRNITEAGFRGEILPINPRLRRVQSIPCYPSVDCLPLAPDLAVITAPPELAPKFIAELGALGTKAAIVHTSIRSYGDRAARQLRCEMLDKARPHLLRIVGPNCLGVIVPGARFNASFSHLQPLAGHIAFVAQSGAVQNTVLDWAISRNIGFSHLITLGDMADVDFGDMLDYLAMDPDVKSILLYMEAASHARKFMSAARAAARMKPVIVVKGGRHVEGARAAATHTGCITASDAIYDAAFRRAGMLRVFDLQDLFDAVETLAVAGPAFGDRLAIVTNGGGIGVLAADSLIDEGGRLAKFCPETIARLNSVLPSWSQENPVDIGSDAPSNRYADVLRAILEDDSVDALLILNSPNPVTSGTESAKAVIETLQNGSRKGRSRVVLTSWLGDRTAVAARRLFCEHSIPTYDTPTDAVRGFMQIVRYRQNQDMLMEIPPSVPDVFSPDVQKAQRIVDKALDQGREMLTRAETRDILGSYCISTAEPLGAESCRESGISTEYSSNAGAVELTIRMITDAMFGPVITFGHGGSRAELIQDMALTLPPLNLALAREVISRTHAGHLLAGTRDLLTPTIDAVCLALVKVSQLVCDVSEIAELDVNPLLVSDCNILALDARIRVARLATPAAQRLAIRPYPKELEETIELPDGPSLLLRPVQPEDEPAFVEFFTCVPPDDIRLRFLHPMKVLPHSLAARLTQIDYDREMALVLIGHGTSGAPEMYGEVRISADPDNERGEFAILLRRELTGTGLGPTLMRKIIQFAHDRGIREIYGDVLSENVAMLTLCKALGFSTKRDPEDPGVTCVCLKLSR